MSFRNKRRTIIIFICTFINISGAYGSEEENRLESILDQTEEMRNRIVEANFKWRQAQMMVDYAHKQLDFAVAKWKDINEIDARYVNFVIISILHFFSFE